MVVIINVRQKMEEKRKEEEKAACSDFPFNIPSLTDWSLRTVGLNQVTVKDLDSTPQTLWFRRQILLTSYATLFPVNIPQRLSNKEHVLLIVYFVNGCLIDLQLPFTIYYFFPGQKETFTWKSNRLLRAVRLRNFCLATFSLFCLRNPRDKNAHIRLQLKACALSIKPLVS